MALYPLTFRPIFKERVWGGRKLEQLYHKALPPNVPIGESWEISDRPGDVSVIANGPLAGKDLHWLLESHRSELLGQQAPGANRFPLLIKILDCREVLSLQVHPPAHQAASLGGEPKTEMWYVAQAEAHSELFVGLKKGATRNEFERRISTGQVAECFHRIQVKPGDAMFLPSGRVHALGSGLVIFEIQQNSDTTYRVFDWNRTGLDGKARPLHIDESLKCIDFEDFEPSLIAPRGLQAHPIERRALLEDPLFAVEEVYADNHQRMQLRTGKAQILALVEGSLRIDSAQASLSLQAGGFCLLPAALDSASIHTEPRSRFLLVSIGDNR